METNITYVCAKDKCRTEKLQYPTDPEFRDTSYMYCPTCDSHVLEDIRHI